MSALIAYIATEIENKKNPAVTKARLFIKAK